MTNDSQPSRPWRAMQGGAVVSHETSLARAKERCHKPFSTVTNIETGERWILDEGVWRPTLPEKLPPSQSKRSAPEPPPRRFRADIDG